MKPDEAAAMESATISLRAYLDERFSRLGEDMTAVREAVDGLSAKVAIQNGRVNKLEMAHAVLIAREEEREKAAKQAASIAESTAKRHATLISTVISLLGVLVSVVALWARGQ